MAKGNEIQQDDFEKEMILISLEEVDESLQNIDIKLPLLEQDAENKELLNTIFRYFHSLKGISGLIKIPTMKKICQKSEDILDKMRDNKAFVVPEVLDLVFNSVDLIKEIISLFKKSYKYVEDDNINKRAGQLYKNIDKSINEVSKKSKKTASKTVKSAKKTTKKIKEDTDDTIRVKIKKLDFIMSLANEIVVNAVQIEDNFKQIDKLVEGINELKSSINSPDTKLKNKTISDKLSEIYNYFNEHTINLKQAIDLVSESSSKLSDGIIKLRMVSINTFFSQFYRLVRDVSRERQKNVTLKVECDEIEIDKKIIEMIYTPIVHILRNSIDHGIETEEERIQKGKKKKSTILLKASEDGMFLNIEIKDDGRGFNPEIIAKKAIKKKLITKTKLKELTEQQIIELTCLPGFSIKDEVTEISGRGVGMDVVKSNIEKMNGSLEIKSELDKGTSIIFIIPTNIALISGFMYEE